MKAPKKMRFALKTIVFFILTTGVFFNVNAQGEAPESIVERFFMPALQMGYIHHQSDNISSGLIIQTSLDYRTKKGLLLRVNYDDFSGRLNLRYTENQTYSARIPISECIAGIGYRLTRKRSNYFIVAQSGIRLYENPEIENQAGNFSINQKGKTIASMRYTAGYEYELFESIFVNAEIFAGHFFASKDFWENEKPFLGLTLGISARLF